MTTFAGIAAVLFYFVSTLLIVMHMRASSFVANQPAGLILASGFVASVCHLVNLYGSLVTSFGIQLGFFTAASAVGFTISLLTLILSTQRKTEILAALVMPLAAIALLLDLAYPLSHMLPPDSPSGLTIHVLISIIAYSLLAVAAMIAIVLAIQNRMLHQHHMTRLLRHLPPLQSMEKLLFDFIMAGFIALGATLITGFVFLENLFEQHLVHKTTLGIVAWFVFGILVVGRLKLGWRGKVAIRWTLSGFIVLMLAYFGSKLVLELIIPA